MAVHSKNAGGYAAGSADRGPDLSRRLPRASSVPAREADAAARKTLRIKRRPATLRVGRRHGAHAHVGCVVGGNVQLVLQQTCLLGLDCELSRTAHVEDIYLSPMRCSWPRGSCASAKRPSKSSSNGLAHAYRSLTRSRLRHTM